MLVKNKDSIKNGINIIRELFKANRLFISKRCENLIYELETYAYPEKKDLKNEDENPIKENDHACDAIRYALASQTGDSKARSYIPGQLDRSTVHNSNGRQAKQYFPSREVRPGA